jgi:hypothetical protein
MQKENAMEPDYPAAHSMDTDWFAVDPDGHIAMFHSGEAGAVPVDATATEDDSLLDRLPGLVPDSEVVYDADGRRTPREGSEWPQASVWSGEETVLLFLSSLKPVLKVISAGRAVEVRATQGKAVLLRHPTEEELQHYHDLPEFRGSYDLYLSEDETEPSSPARLGLYEYGHLTENWISGPYGREMVPAQPLHIDQLPPNLRRKLGQLRLNNVRFADMAHIQPVEHAECESWESAYLDVNCQRIRPIPGKEEEYAEHFEDYYADSEYEAEPPASE